MKYYDFDWQINEFMVYCRSTQLRDCATYSYEQTLRLLERWCADELKNFSVDKVTENMIRKYINDLQERGKYTFFVNDLSKKKNYPERRRDFRRDIIKTFLVVRSAHKNDEEDLSFWETVVALVYNAIERLCRRILTVAKRKGRISPPFQVFSYFNRLLVKLLYL